MRTLCAALTFAVAASLALRAEAQVPVLTVDKTCKVVSAPDLDVDDPGKEVVLRVRSKCKDPQAVLGAYRALDSQDNPTANFYPVMECQYKADETVTAYQAKVGTITCKINAACAGAYRYNVCVSGKWAYDPEIRIKGGRTDECKLMTEKPGAPKDCKKAP